MVPRSTSIKASKNKGSRPKAKAELRAGSHERTRSEQARRGPAHGTSRSKKDSGEDVVEDVLRKEILALGGDESDVQLLKDVDESSDLGRGSSEEDESVQDVRVMLFFLF
jgi:hypothetical protein